MRVSSGNQAHCLAVGFFALMSAISTGCGLNSPSEPESINSPATETGTVKSGSASLPFAQPVNRLLRPWRDTDWFRDITTDSGVNFTYRDGSESGHYQLLESIGGGAVSLDYDQDGRQDLCFAGGGSIHANGEALTVGGRPAAVYRNAGDSLFSDITSRCSLTSNSIYTHGVLAADIDSDGFPDLTIAGYGGLQVWWNTGDGRFRESSEQLGVVSNRWNVTVADGDFNRDSFVDLYVLTYADWQPDRGDVCYNDQQLRDVCGPSDVPGDQDLLLQNDGLRFHDVTNDAQLVGRNRGLGVVSADIDQNGYLDVFVVNDVQENHLYLNSGAWPFREDGLLAGVAYSIDGQREGSMGVDLNDFDGDGFPDLWYTNYSHQDNSLLKNQKNQGFTHYAERVGLTGVSRRWVGFGTGFCDFNCDGWPDIYVLNGHVGYEWLDSPYFQPPQLFQNHRGQRYIEVTQDGGAYFEHSRSGRGSACVDWDNNGTMDLVMVHQNEPVALLRNQHNSQHWIRVRLVARHLERTAVGAKVEVQTKGRTLTQWRISGGSYLSGNDRRLLFSLPDDEPVSVTVTWLGGISQTHRLSPGNYTIIEGDRACATP